MEKKFYFFLSLLLLLGSTSYAQFQEVAQYDDYPTNLEHTSRDHLGVSVAMDGAYIVSGTNDHMGIGAAYVFYNNGVTFDTLAVLTPSDGNIGDSFADAVAISGDVIVIGSAGQDANASNEGAAYVFIKPSSGWEDMTETLRLPASEIGSNSKFGTSVAISGDNIVVGATGMNGAGAAYVYEKPSTGWIDILEPTAKLNSSDGVNADSFGSSVDISSDYIAVGALGDDDNGSSSGSAYVYEKPIGSWVDATETAKLTASDGVAFVLFGQRLSISNDVIVVASKYALSKQGVAYVYVKPLGSWVTATETAKLTASDAASSDFFGASISMSGDVIAVGADSDDDNGSGSGSVYIFEKPSLGWATMTETTKIHPSEAFSGDGFGKSVCIDGDYLAAGATYFDGEWDDSGAVFVFAKDPAGWAPSVEIAKLLPRNHPNINNLKIGSQVAIDNNIAVIGEGIEGFRIVEVLEFDGLNWGKVATLSPSDGSTGDRFGESLSVSGDVIVVGSPANATGGTVYVYEKPSTGWEDMTETAKLSSSDVSGFDNFGESVSISGDLVGVGASGVDDNGSSSGAVYVYEKLGAGWVTATEDAKLLASDGAGSDGLGSSISVSNDIIVSGAHTVDNGGSNKGAAYVYKKPVSGWVNATETAKLSASDAEDSDYFGRSVGISGDVIVVGADGDDDNGTSSGSAYVFEKPSSGWVNATETAKLLASDGTSYDNFGYSISISGDVIVSGAYGVEGSGVYNGAAYIFVKPISGWASNTEDQILSASDESSYFYFSYSVAISNNYIIGGSPYYGNTFYHKGSAYLFQAPLTWTGATSTDWHTTTNWDFGVLPQDYDEVFIDSTPLNQPEITSFADCYDIELDATASLGLLSDVSSTASLIIAGSYTGAADVEFERYMVGTEWHLTGSPFSDYAIADYISSSNLVNDGTNYSMKDYVESSDSWAADYLASAAGNMELGKGYVAKNASSGTAYFQGTPNTAAVNKTLTRDGNGWNLLSNPFTSAIAANSDGGANNLLTDNASVLDPNYTALYIWDQASTSYKIINHVSSNASEEFDQDYLQVGQGFFVKSKSGGGSFEITPAMQSHQTTVAFKQSANTSWAGIKLIAETAEAITSTQVSYQETMTRGLDVGYDAGLFNTNPNFVLYSKLIDDNGVDFMLQCLPTDYEHLVISIGLDAEAGTTITFKAEVSNLPEDYVAVLEDRENGTFTAFETEQSVYTVTLDNASMGTGRFYLRTSFKSSVGINDLGQSNFSVYAQTANNQLLINGSIEENTTAKVYDIRGKLVKSFDLQLGTQNRLLFNEQSGVYIIQIQNSKGIVSKKVNWVK